MKTKTKGSKVKVFSKSTPKKRSTKKKATKVSILTRFQNLSKKGQLLVFGIIFALIGGGYMLYQSMASDGLPDKANQLVISYEVGMPHVIPEDNFPTGKGNISMLVYGNGLMLCSGADNMPGMGQNMGEMPAWNYRQLTRDQVRTLVDDLKQAGFDKAAAYRQAPGGFLPPAASGRFIRLNSTVGATEAFTYPTFPDTGFTKAEQVLKNECAKTTTPYEPDDVVAETVVLSSDNPDASKATAELPASADSDVVPKERKSKELKGNDAKAVRSQLTREPKLYKKGNTVVRARYVDRIPDWEAFKAKKTNTSGKVSAAAVYNTRWLIVLGADQAAPSWATSATASADANSVRSWYAGKTGKYFDIATAQVVRGSKTADQYKVCPAGVTCSSSSQAVFYNLANEFRKAGSSTQIVTAFSFHDWQADGWGDQDALDGWYTRDYGTTGISDGSFTQGYRRQVSAHEFGHNASLGHVCDGTLMWAGGSCPVPANWSSTALNGSQAATLNSSSPFFSGSVPPAGMGMMQGTSPAIYGSDVVFQANTGNLYRKVIGGSATNLNLGMANRTNPSISGTNIAFQANTTDLFRKVIGGSASDLGLGMMPGTSPSIDGNRIVFQANTSNLYMKVIGGGTTNFGLGMDTTTSPAISGDNIVFQANTHNLFRKVVGGTTIDLKLGMMPGTSPAIYGSNVVFQANTGNLYLRVLGGGTYNLGLGMAGGTSPAIYGDRVVFQANTGHLYFRNISNGNTRDLGLGMAPGTSPAIYGDNVVFQANTGTLWRYNFATGGAGAL